MQRVFIALAVIAVATALPVKLSENDYESLFKSFVTKRGGALKNSGEIVGWGTQGSWGLRGGLRGTQEELEQGTHDFS
jgi:hypothetical protein